MKTTERILLALVLIGTIMRLCSVEGGIFLTFVSFTLLSLFYFFFSVFLLNGTGMKGFYRKVKARELPWPRICWAILAGLVWFGAVIGLLFYINRWEGSMLFVTVGTTLLLPVFGIALFKFVSGASKFHAGVLIRTSVLLILGIACLVIKWFWV